MLRHATAAALIVVMGLLLALSMREESPTTDENLHLTRGVSFYWGPDVSLSYAHPPLGNAWAALPIVLSEAPESIADMPGFEEREVSEVAKGLLQDQYDERRHWFFLGRAAVACLTLLLGIYLYTFALRFFGTTAALLALFFFALHPTLIAHGRLLTTDMPVTAAMLVALGEVAKFLCGDSRWRALSAALALGVGLATKYTAAAMGPIVTVIVVVVALRGLGRYRGWTRGRALGEAAVLLVAFGLVSLAIVNAAYRFDGTMMSVSEVLEHPEPDNGVTRRFEGQMLEQESLLPSLPSWLPLPLPYSYIVGVASVAVHEKKGHPTTFFGRFDQDGDPAYFPVMLAIKTPTLLLCALALGLWMVARRRFAMSLPAGVFAFFSVALLGLSMRASINIGVRHVLPIVPAMTLLGGLAVARWLPRLPEFKLRRTVLGGLALAHASGLIWAYPDYLADFNALVGGAAGGERISIVGEEWGQDMVRLGRAAKAHGIDKLLFRPDSFTAALELRRFGVELERSGCPKTRPKRDHIAVSARTMSRDSGRCFGWAKDLEPLFTVERHIFVYEGKPRDR